LALYPTPFIRGIKTKREEIKSKFFARVPFLCVCLCVCVWLLIQKDRHHSTFCDQIRHCGGTSTQKSGGDDIFNKKEKKEKQLLTNPFHKSFFSSSSYLTPRNTRQKKKRKNLVGCGTIFLFLYRCDSLFFFDLTWGW
jgi:hypothetical protein